jgi:hypothetical protein
MVNIAAGMAQLASTSAKRITASIAHEWGTFLKWLLCMVVYEVLGLLGGPRPNPFRLAWFFDKMFLPRHLSTVLTWEKHFVEKPC